MQIPSWLSDLWSQIPALLLAAGGGSALTVGMVRKLATNWLDGRFNKNLEVFKHKQAKEIQRLRLEIDALLSGAIKLQEREFEILPEIWSRVDEATRLVRSLISPFTRVEDFSLLPEEGIVEIMNERKVPQYRILEILNLKPEHRLGAMRQWEFEEALRFARDAHQRLQDTASRFAIFLSPSLRDLLQDSTLQLGLVIGTKEAHRGRTGEYTLPMATFDEKVLPIKERLRAEIAGRLRGHGIREESDALRSDAANSAMS